MSVNGTEIISRFPNIFCFPQLHLLFGIIRHSQTLPLLNGIPYARIVNGLSKLNAVADDYQQDEWLLFTPTLFIWRHKAVGEAGLVLCCL